MSFQPDFMPDFMIVGATRCGTSSLHQALARHPALCLPRKKETKFFYHTRQFQQDLPAYERYFRHRRVGQLCGEVCPAYFEHGLVIGADGSPAWQAEDDSAARIAAAYPRLQIFITLRDPIARLNSIFWKHKREGRESAETLEQLVAEELAGKRSAQDTPLCSLWRCRYAVHLQRWFELFPADQVHLLIFEDWTRNPALVGQALSQGLALPDMGVNMAWWGQVLARRRNVGRVEPIGGGVLGAVVRRFLTPPALPPVSRDLQAQLCDVFAADKRFVEDKLGRKLPLWLSNGDEDRRVSNAR